MLRKNKGTNLRHARWFGNVFRFIDDLAALDDGVVNLKEVTRIYTHQSLTKIGK